MQTIPLHRFYQVSGIIAAIAARSPASSGQLPGSDTLAWIYLQSTEAITNATHIHRFPWTGWTRPARSACSSTQPQEAL